jgi:hypothetical protein
LSRRFNIYKESTEKSTEGQIFNRDIHFFPQAYCRQHEDLTLLSIAAVRKRRPMAANLTLAFGGLLNIACRWRLGQS